MGEPARKGAERRNETTNKQRYSSLEPANKGLSFKVFPELSAKKNPAGLLRANPHPEIRHRPNTALSRRGRVLAPYPPAPVLRQRGVPAGSAPPPRADSTPRTRLTPRVPRARPQAGEPPHATHHAKPERSEAERYFIAPAFFHFTTGLGLANYFQITGAIFSIEQKAH